MVVLASRSQSRRAAGFQAMDRCRAPSIRSGAGVMQPWSMSAMPLTAARKRTSRDFRVGPMLLKKSPCRSCRIRFRNKRIMRIDLLNQCCASEAHLESILLGQARKIFFQQYRPQAEVA